MCVCEPFPSPSCGHFTSKAFFFLLLLLVPLCCVLCYQSLVHSASAPSTPFSIWPCNKRSHFKRDSASSGLRGNSVAHHLHARSYFFLFFSFCLFFYQLLYLFIPSLRPFLMHFFLCVVFKPPIRTTSATRNHFSRPSVKNRKNKRETH